MASATIDVPVGDEKVSSVTIAALCVVNARGSLIDPSSGRAWEPHPQLKSPSSADRQRYAEHVDSLTAASLNTTVGVVATDAQIVPFLVNVLRNFAPVLRPPGNAGDVTTARARAAETVARQQDQAALRERKSAK